MSVRWVWPLLALSVWGCGPSLGSIGAMLGKSHQDGRLVVREVPADMSAAQSGLREGDEILLIEGRDVRRMNPQEIHDAMVGPVGSRVRLTVLRGEQVLRLEVPRGPLK